MRSIGWIKNSYSLRQGIYGNGADLPVEQRLAYLASCQPKVGVPSYCLLFDLLFAMLGLSKQNSRRSTSPSSENA